MHRDVFCTYHRLYFRLLQFLGQIKRTTVPTCYSTYRLLRWNRPSEGEAITREGGVYHSIPRTAPLKGQPVERASGG